jgi:glycosyltransferase involved in cell wall biosynthesis
MSESQHPLVSVYMLTYNHEKYIAQAIEGVMMQQTDFSVELVIGEDCSKDRTRRICREYKAKYPDRIKLLLPERNIGIDRNGTDTMNACTGKYVAICEGDDYWTDPNKLQRQVDFLEANPQYTMCVHQCQSIYEYIDREPELFTRKPKDTFTLNDIFEGCPFHMATVAVRSEYPKMDGGIPNNIVSGDRCLYMLCAAHGPIKFLPETMSVYRINRTGISSRVTAKLMELDLNMAPWLVRFCPGFPKYHCLAQLHKTIITYPPRVPFFTYLQHSMIYAWYSFSFFPKNIIPLFKFTFLTTPKFAAKRLFPNLKWKRLQAWR